MPGPLAAAVGLGIGSTLIGASASKSAAKTQARSADQQMALQGQMFNRMDDLQKSLYGAQGTTIAQNTQGAQDTAGNAYDIAKSQAGKTRDANQGLNKNALRAGASRTRDAMYDTYRENNATYARGMGQAKNALTQNLSTYGKEKNASLGYFEPSIARGNDAGAAYSYNLGIGDKPANYSGMQQSEGTKFLMNAGRQAIEGGAAGAGNLYSGATLAAAMKKNQGLASLDKDNQMSQLMAQAGLGQGAANSAAGVRAGYADDVAGQRTGYRDAALGLDQTRNAGNTSARNLGTGTLNALQDTYAGRGIGINADYGNAITGAANTLAGRRTDAFNLNTANLGAARANRANLQGSAAANYMSGASSALANKGDAQAAGTIGTANAVMGGVNNALGMYGMMGGTFGSQAAQGAAQGSPFANPFATMKPNFWQGAQY